MILAGEIDKVEKGIGVRFKTCTEIKPFPKTFQNKWILENDGKNWQLRMLIPGDKARIIMVDKKIIEIQLLSTPIDIEYLLNSEYAFITDFMKPYLEKYEKNDQIDLLGIMFPIIKKKLEKEYIRHIIPQAIQCEVCLFANHCNGIVCLKNP